MDEYITLSQAQKKLNLSRLTLYRYIKNGSLKAYKFGRDYRISAEDLQAFINSKRVK